MRQGACVRGFGGLLTQLNGAAVALRTQRFAASQADFVGALSSVADAVGMGQADQSPAAQGRCIFPFPGSGAGLGALRALTAGGEEAPTADRAEGPWTLLL